MPKSASASITASATPPASAGRASGNATRRTAWPYESPSERAASMRWRDCPRKALRPSTYT